MTHILERNAHKYCPPQMSDSLVIRNVYHKLTIELLTKKLHICVAPAGYGKTTLLGQCQAYFKAKKVATLWVTINELESTPAGFVNTLIKNYEEVFIKSTGQNAPQTEHGQLSLLLASLANCESPLIIFLDNYHLIDNELIIDLVNKLLNCANHNVHFCFISRNDPNFFYTSYLLEETASLIDVNDFKFSRKNVDDYIANNVNIQRTLSMQEHQIIYSKTEGWPIAVQLCGMLINQSSSTEFLDDFSGRDIDLGSFLNEQVFHSIPEYLQKFIVLSSLFENFNAELCNEVLQINNAKQLIDEVYRQKLFIYSLDRNKSWFRFHYMFREFLFTTQWKPNDKTLTDIYSRAATWSRKCARFSDAINYSIQAKDFAFAKDILISSAKVIARDEGLLPNLLLWNEKVPDSNTTESMELHYWLAWSLTFTCRTQEAEKEISTLEKRLEQEKPFLKAEKIKYKSRISALRIVIGNFQNVNAKGHKSTDIWLKKYKKIADPFDVGMVAGTLFLSARLQLEIFEARKALIMMKKSLVGTQSSYGKLWLTIFDSCFEMEFGSYHVAEKTLEVEYNHLNNKGKSGTVMRYTLALLLAKVTYETGDIDRATALLSDGYSHITDHGFADTAAAGLEVKVKIAARKDIAAALCLLNQAEFTLSHFGPNLLFIIRKLRFELLFNSGDIVRAYAEAKIAGVMIINDKIVVQKTELGNAFINEEKILIGVAMLFQMKCFSEAKKQLELLLDKNSTKQRAKFNVELLIKLSGVLFQRGNKKQACRTALKALQISSKDGFYNVFNDNKYYLVPVFNELASKRAQKAELPEDALFSRLVSDFGISVENKTVNDAIIEKITQREKELLILLQTDLSVQGLADHLFLSKATVKWHLSNIYRKLGVKNRSGALNVSQKIGVTS